MPFCPDCGTEVAGSTNFCPKCGQKLGIGVIGEERPQGRGLVIWGYVCGVLALFVFPIGFGIAGVVIGIVNLTRSRVGHGIAQIVLGVTLGFLGAVWGALVWGW